MKKKLAIGDLGSKLAFPSTHQYAIICTMREPKKQKNIASGRWMGNTARSIHLRCIIRRNIQINKSTLIVSTIPNV